MNIDIEFSRQLLRQIVPTLKEKGMRVLKDAWVYGYGRDQWEFHGPNKFFWHGRASNAYEARFKGWQAWLDR
jgi:hypothetical protein